MSDHQAAVNDALERVSLGVLDQPARDRALAPFGEAVATAAEALHNEAVSEPPPEYDENDAGRGRVEALLAIRHPWLSERARGNLVTAYLYNWK